MSDVNVTLSCDYTFFMTTSVAPSSLKFAILYECITQCRVRERDRASHCRFSEVIIAKIKDVAISWFKEGLDERGGDFTRKTPGRFSREENGIKAVTIKNRRKSSGKGRGNG